MEKNEPNENEDQGKRDSWTKTFDPLFAVKKVIPTTPPFTWEDYVAEPHVKSQLQRICYSSKISEDSYLAELMRRIRVITRGSAKQPEKTAQRVVLLHGPPGCGKTHAIRVMAGTVAEENNEVYHVDLTSLKSTWYNQTEHQLKIVLNHIGKLRNSIVFIDEIDSFVAGHNRSDKRHAPLLTEVLQWIDGIETKADKNLTIICATNCMETCDAAFRSRCSLKIEIPPPSRQLRLKWWNLKAIHLSAGEREKLSCCPVDSFRCIEQLVNEAEQTSAVTVHAPPCYADYRQRIDRLAQSSKKGKEANVGSHRIDHTMTQEILDRAKAIAASTAAMTVMGMKSEDRKMSRPWTFQHVTENTNDDAELSSHLATQNDANPRVGCSTAVDSSPYVIAQDTDSRDNMELFCSRLTKLESVISSKLGYDVMQKEIAELKLSLSELCNDKGAVQDQINALNCDMKEIKTVLQNEIKAMNREIQVYREWDTVEVSMWEIEDFRTATKRLHQISLYSQDFYVAGYAIRLKLEVEAKKYSMGDDDRGIGIYLCHHGGLHLFPIRIDKTTVTLVGVSIAYDKTLGFGEGEEIGEEHKHGWGWAKIATLHEVFEKHTTKNGKVMIKANVRIRRINKTHVHTV